MSPFRRPLARVLAVATVTALAPATLAAQAAAPAGAGEHVVRRGDTLWDLSGSCLGNPFRWPELHQANQAVVANPHRIYPGERLRMPCETAADATAAPATPEAVPAEPATAVVGAMDVRSTAPTRLAIPVTEPAPAAPAAAQDGLEGRRRLDYLSAPYAAPGGPPAGAGHVFALEPARPSALAPGRRLLLGDEVRLELPAGVAPVPGARFVAVRRGVALPDGAIVVRPTGIVEVREFEGAMVRGRVVGLLDAMQTGQELLPVPAPAPAAAAPAAGATATVAWAEDGALLPSIQDWVILKPAAGATLGEGDRVQLVQPVTDAAGAVVGEEVVATARVIRVTAEGASAMLTSVRKPVVGAGIVARVVAGAD